MEELTKKEEIIGVIVLVIIFAVIFRVMCVRTIKSEEVGIKVRFGKIVNTSLDDGLNLKIPFIEKIVKMNIQVQKTEVDTSGASKDLQDISTKIAVNYKVNPKKATQLYKRVGTKYEEVVLQPAIQEAIKSVLSQYTAEELITKRSEVSSKSIEVLENKVKNYGIDIDNFNITNFNFSDEFNKAIEEKQVAEQNVLKAQQELEKSKVEAEKKVVEAESTKKANDLLNQTLTKEVLMQKFIDKWNGELPKVSDSKNLFDISELIK